MRFSEQFESRFTEMLTHYPTKRSVLVPTLLYAQDEVGYLSEEVIAELAGATRQTVNQVLREEEKRGTIELTRGHIGILDVSQLVQRR